jgi:hypothetical protein
MAKDKLLTPQQEAFLSYYTNPKSETFGNARQSALKAGYAETYADNITDSMPEWLLENIGDMKLLNKAEKVLNSTLDYEPVNKEGKIDTSLLSIQNKTAQFVAERLNKDKYSSRQEQTGKGGKDLIPDTLSKEQKEKLLALLND